MVQVVASVRPSGFIMRWFLLLLPLLSPVISGCAVNHVTTFGNEAPATYTLDTGDELRITVYGDTTLTNTYKVTDKGTVSFPLVGQVTVRGQSITSAEAAITRLLSRGYMINPKVSVEVLNYRPFFIEGAVTTGGQYAYVYGMTVRAAVAVAGGFKDFADRDHVTIYRGVGPHQIRRDVLLSELVMPGDTLVISERWF